MLLWRTIQVGDQERALLIVNGRFQEILDPGTHRIPSFGRDVEFEVGQLNSVAYSGAWATFLLQERPDLIARYFVVVETGDTEVAVIRVNGAVTGIIGPSVRRLYWRGPDNLTVETIDASKNIEVPAAIVPVLPRLGRDIPATTAFIDEGRTGLLYRDNKLIRELPAGAFGFWTANGAVGIEVVDLRRQTLEIPGQEILTKDKVSIRVNVCAEYRIVNAVLWKQAVKDSQEQLYKMVQLVVRQSNGMKTLEEALADKGKVDVVTAQVLRDDALEFGVKVGEIAIKDIILPGEMRAILNQVITAEKQAQANLIRRREETAATLSLLNTVKLMEENPLLIRMKELETLEKVVEKVGKISIRGGFDTLLQRVVTIRARDS